MAVLERALTQRPWLAAAHFTVADLSVAAVLSPSRARRLRLSDYPAANDWLLRCYRRPAAQATRAKYA